MKKILSVAMICGFLLMVSCQNKTKDQTTTEPTSADSVQVDSLAQAQKYNTLPIQTVDELMATIDEQVGQTVRIMGLCGHVCHETRRRLFLKSDSTKNMIRCVPEDKAPYEIALETQNLLVVGTVVEDRIDEAYLQNWEKELKEAAQQAPKEAQETDEARAQALKNAGAGGHDGEHAGQDVDAEAVEGACATEKEEHHATGHTPEEQIADFRAQIAARQAKEGKDYLSFYHIVSVQLEPVVIQK